MSTVKQIESVIAELEPKEVHALADWLAEYRAAVKTARAGSARSVRQTMRGTPHLETADVTALETAIGRGKIPVSEPWVFNDRK